MRLQLLAPRSLVLRRRPFPTPSAPPPPLRRGGAAAPTATTRAAPTPAAASSHRGGGCRGLVRRRRLGVPQRAEAPRELLPRGARLCQLCKQRQPVRPAAGTVAGAEGRVHRPLVGVMVGAEGAEHEQRRADVAGGAQRVHHGRVADEGGAHVRCSHPAQQSECRACGGSTTRAAAGGDSGVKGDCVWCCGLVEEGECVAPRAASLAGGEGAVGRDGVW
mmetsp:Transcript_9062/g.26430  ORF Transcript_9062/g.26430 Transcript_9062/m.26430 type:complete len:219 (+) Transcript_9062:226-882(+)